MKTRLELEKESKDMQVFIFAEKINSNIVGNAYLSQRERQRLSMFKREEDRRRYTIARRKIKIFLGQKLNCHPSEIIINQRCPDCELYHGRPEIEGVPEWNVSISHSGQWVAVAVCKDHSIGIDVEQVRCFQYQKKMLSYLLHPHESTEYKNLPECQRPMFLLKKWVRKEALLKMHGAGLRLSPSDICIEEMLSPVEVSWWRNSEFDVTSIGLDDVQLDSGYWCSVAVVGKSSTELKLNKYILF